MSIPIDSGMPYWGYYEGQESSQRTLNTLDRLASEVEIERWPAPLIDVLKAQEDLLSFPEYQAFAEDRAVILSHSHARRDLSVRGLRLVLGDYLRVRKTSRPVLKRELRLRWNGKRQTVLGILALLALAGLAVTFSLVALPVLGGWASGLPELLLALLVVSLVYLAVKALNPIHIETKSGKLVITDLDGGIARRNYAYAIAERALEEINVSISRLEGQRVIFAGRLPQLGVSDPTTLTPSRTYFRIAEMLESQTSAAIGLAGHRGSGKTSIVTLLHLRNAPDRLSILLKCPVRHESIDLTRWIMKEVCKRILADRDRPQSTSTLRLREGPFSVFRLVLAGFLVVAAVIATGLAGLPVELTASLSVWLWPLALWLLLVLVFMAPRPIFERVQLTQHGEDPASTLLEALEFEVSTSSLRGAELSVDRGARLSEVAEKSKRSREMSLPELSQALEDLLNWYTTQSRSSVEIYLDELDKISDPADLVSVINGVKEMFRIPQVHFVVSVSDEALYSFERRGFFARDEFDSSFDLIVRVEPIRASEAVSMIQSRSVGYPPVFASLSHGWSGGVPRDALRFARRIGEIYFSDSTKTVGGLLEVFVREDLLATLDVVLRESRWSDELADIIAVRTRLSDTSTEFVAVSRLIEDVLDAKGERFDQSVLVWLQSASLGLAFVDFLASAVDDRAPTMFSSDQMLLVSDAVAAAYGCRQDPYGVWFGSYQTALAACTKK